MATKFVYKELTEEGRELLHYISATPVITSLLYDLDLLPEQINDHKRLDQMLVIVGHFKSALDKPAAAPALPADVKGLVRDVRAIADMLDRIVHGATGDGNIARLREAATALESLASRAEGEWNAAIEAAAQSAQESGAYSGTVIADEIRGLLRPAPPQEGPR